MSKDNSNELNTEATELKPSHGSGRPILIGLIAGIVLGLILQNAVDVESRNWIVKNLLNPVGIAFLRSLFMIVVPLVFTSLMTGVAQLGSTEKLGRLGGRIVAFYIATTIVAILIGQAVIMIARPGDGVPRDVVVAAQEQFGDQINAFKKSGEEQKQALWPGLVESVIPKNIIEAMAGGEMLAIIFVALLSGIALMTLPKEKADLILGPADTVFEACIVVVGWIMKLAPFAVAALVAAAISFFGIGLMKNVLLYMLVVILGYGLHLFGTFGLVSKYLLRVPVKEFIKRMMPVMVTAFSTSSSNAAIPTIIRTLDKSFGVPEKITSFSIPLGATVNQNGSALFEVVAALFIAQVYGIHLGVADQLTLILLVLLTSIGVSGIPGGSIPLLMTAMATVGIPPEGIALILGVDRILDMGRSVLNAVGDALGAMYLARVEGATLLTDLPIEVEKK
ncbi:MAG: dicarboxylate/amino acid:cation symporter [Bdellovibrionaceae bacterium]|nr:dicarboxylate/amino acid:cation symporter [Pseudobdellovibrionaceae bacterium]